MSNFLASNLAHVFLQPEKINALLAARAGKQPLVLGVTGGIACGKSYICNLFQKLGAKVISADLLAREVVLPGSAILSRIVQSFGPGVLTSHGTLDRAALAREIFNNPDKRAELNRIIHPAIAILAEEQLSKQVLAATAPLIVYEAPLLYEAHAEDRVDLTLVVAIDEIEQLQRLMKRDNLSQGEAKERIRAQMPLHEKIARADILVDNTPPPESAESTVQLIFSALTEPQKKPPF